MNSFSAYGLRLDRITVGRSKDLGDCTDGVTSNPTPSTKSSMCNGQVFLAPLTTVGGSGLALEISER